MAKRLGGNNEYVYPQPRTHQRMMHQNEVTFYKIKIAISTLKFCHLDLNLFNNLSITTYKGIDRE